MCKYEDIMFFYPLQARCKVQDLEHLHVQDFPFLHIKNVQVPRHYIFSLPTSKVISARSFTFGHTRFYILAHPKCACTKTLCFFTHYRKMNIARFCIFACARFCILAHQKWLSTKTLRIFTSHMQGAKCKILHIYTCKILYSCTSKMCKYQDIIFFHLLQAYLHMQDFAFLHIKNVHVPWHFVFSFPACKIYSARSCTFAHARFCIIAHQKCASTKTLCFVQPLDVRCKVQDLAHLHVQDFALLHIKNVQVPRHYKLSLPTGKVQCAKSCTFAYERFCILAHQKCESSKSFCLSPL